MPHPCFGRDLRSATKLAAVVDIVWTSTFIGVAIVIIITSATSFIEIHPVPPTYDPVSKTTPVNKEGEGEDVMKIALGGLIVGTIILVVKILQLILAIFLLQGALERNHYKCKIWIYITCVFVIITVMNFLFDVYSVEGSNIGSIISMMGIVLHIYFLWVVWAYKQELERGLAQPESEAAVAMANKA